MDVLVEMLHRSKHFFPFALVSFSLEQTFSSVRWVMYFCGTCMFTGLDNSAIRRKEISQMEIFLREMRTYDFYSPVLKQQKTNEWGSVPF